MAVGGLAGHLSRFALLRFSRARRIAVLAARAARRRHRAAALDVALLGIGLAIAYRVLQLRMAAAASAALTLAAAVNRAVLLTIENCYVEPLVVLDMAAAMLVLSDRRLAGSPRRQAIILGILAGGAAAVKLTGLAVAIAVGAWYATRSIHKLRRRRTENQPRISRMTRIRQTLSDPRSSLFIRGLLLFGLATVVVAAPFYLRPWSLAGDPFYPYFAQWFPAHAARLEMSRFHHELGSKFGLYSGAAFFEAPVFLAFMAELYDGSFGWQWLILLVLAAMAARPALHRTRGALTIGPAVAALWLYAFWFLTAQQARFAVPFMLALLPLSAVGLTRVRGIRRTAVLSAILVASLGAPVEKRGTLFRLVDGGPRRDQPHGLCQRIDGQELSAARSGRRRATPADARLMLLFEHRGFYLRRSYILGTPFFQEGPFTPPERFTEAAEILKVLEDERITHVVVPTAPVGPDVLPDWINRTDPFFAAFAQCVKDGHLTPIWQSERYVLLHVNKRE